MKRSLTLVEVLISIILLTVVIAVILQIKTNNLFYLEKFKKSTINNSYISLVVTQATSNRNENIYLKDKLNLNDDEINKEFKDIKINVKDIAANDILFEENDYIKTAKVTQSIYSIDQNENDHKQSFFIFKFE